MKRASAIFNCLVALLCLLAMVLGFINGNIQRAIIEMILAFLNITFAIMQFMLQDIEHKLKNEQNNK